MIGTSILIPIDGIGRALWIGQGSSHSEGGTVVYLLMAEDNGSMGGNIRSIYSSIRIEETNWATTPVTVRIEGLEATADTRRYQIARETKPEEGASGAVYWLIAPNQATIQTM